jgi:hypothetical protein
MGNTYISRNITTENPYKGTAKHFPAVSCTGYWDRITKHEVLFEAWWGILPSTFICCLLFGQGLSQSDKWFRCYMSPDNSLFYFLRTVVPSYPPVMRSKTYHGYVNLRIIQNALYNVLLVYHRIDAMHLGLKEGPFCPMLCTKLKEPCSFVKVPHGPYI